MCGLPASGKTTIGNQLAAHTGFAIIRSCDVYRDLGISLPEWVRRTRGFTENIADYEQERDRAYEEMARRLQRLLAQVPSALVVDAVHGERSKRQVVYDICAGRGVTPTIVWCRCEDMNEVRRRLALRVGRESEPEHEASDWSVFQHILSLWEDPGKDRLPGGAAVPVVICDTLARRCRPAGPAGASAMEFIRPALQAVGSWRIDD